MKKSHLILNIASTVLSVITCVLCIVTLSVVLGSTGNIGAAPQIGPDQNASEEIITETVDIVVSTSALKAQNGTDWHFTFPLNNDTDSALKLKAIYINDYMGGFEGERLNEYELLRDRFVDAGLANNGEDMILAPGESSFWEDWHPVVDFFDKRSYHFVFTDGNGTQVTYIYQFELSMEGAFENGAAGVDYSVDPGRNLLTLRHDAEFSFEVHDGVYWVPAATLGKSDFCNADVYGMLPLSPEEKQAQIDTVYEAMQLYQVGAFHASDDNIRVFENGVNWEHHKPGYDAVRTNNGCCATSANWLTYILRDDYDEVGYIATSQPDGSGHIFNYVRQGEWYYIIDMTHYRTDWIATAVESGSLDDYYSTDFISGNIHRVKDIGRYVDYVQSVYNEPPAMMFMYTAENCLALDSTRSSNSVKIVYEKAAGVELNVIFDNPDDNVGVVYKDAPQQLPDWSAIPAYNFG